MLMLGNLLEETLHALPSATVTEIFLYLTLGVLVLSLYEASKGKHSNFVEYAPTLMTSLGILGTFVGVVIGLLHFDTAAIDKSIPALLGGLKTAFLTSVVGMGAAMDNGGNAQPGAYMGGDAAFNFNLQLTDRSQQVAEPAMTLLLAAGLGCATSRRRRDAQRQSVSVNAQ